MTQSGPGTCGGARGGGRGGKRGGETVGGGVEGGGGGRGGGEGGGGGTALKVQRAGGAGVRFDMNAFKGSDRPAAASVFG